MTHRVPKGSPLSQSKAHPYKNECVENQSLMDLWQNEGLPRHSERQINLIAEWYECKKRFILSKQSYVTFFSS